MQADGRPTLVCCRTTIGFGAPNKQGTAGSHGAALGEDEVALARRNLNWGCDPFEIPAEIREDWDMRSKGDAAQGEWDELFSAYAAQHPQLADAFQRRMGGELLEGWDQPIMEFAAAQQLAMTSLATRKSSQQAIGAVAAGVPELFGGSADLTGSNLTRWEGADESQHMSYGVREFGMSAISNGMLLHGGYRPFTGTFLVFMEYARNAVRLAALMKIPNIFVYTHDSVAVGEDGPTHQPVEQITNLRTTPGIMTWRPCDTVETAIAWREAIASSEEPSALIFTRQNTQPQRRDEQTFASISRGGYVLRDCQGEPDLILIATGSEVELAVGAAEAMSDVAVRVVSMPCVERFLAQQQSYREAVLPSSVRSRVAVEAGHPDYWYRFVGLDGAVVGIDRYGMSAPGGQAMAELGMTIDNVVAVARGVL